MLKVPNVDKYIWAHSSWKTHIRKAIDTGVSEFTVENTCKDDRCELGKWIYGLQSEQKTAPEWTKLKAMHAQFHTEAGQVLKLALDGRKQDAEQALAIGSAFSKVSSGLVMFLTELK